MISNINDLSLFLHAVGRFPANVGVEEKRLFLLVHDRYPYVQWEIQPRPLLKLALRLNLLEKRNKRIVLTPRGKIVVDMSTHPVDLNRQQKAYLVENCIVVNPSFSHLRRFLRRFAADPGSASMSYNTDDYPEPGPDSELLVQLGVVSKDQMVWTLSRDYIDLVEDMIAAFNLGRNAAGVATTAAQMESIIREQREIGEKGEALTMAYEKSRLENRGLFEEASRIEHVSLTNSAAGYDIASFSGKHPSPAHDMFIEVKSRKRALNSFMMSANEVKVAKSLGTKYAIYFWHGLGYAAPLRPTRIVVNPSDSLNIDDCANCMSYMVYLDDA